MIDDWTEEDYMETDDWGRMALEDIDAGAEDRRDRKYLEALKSQRVYGEGPRDE